MRPLLMSYFPVAQQVNKVGQLSVVSCQLRGRKARFRAGMNKLSCAHHCSKECTPRGRGRIGEAYERPFSRKNARAQKKHRRDAGATLISSHLSLILPPRSALHFFFSIFAQVSFSVTVRLKTSRSAVESGSTQK